MREPIEDSPKRNYRWPWFVWAMVALGIILTIVWVGLAAKKIERERDYNAPLPASAPTK